jgi:hypothetical protein
MDRNREEVMNKAREKRRRREARHGRTAKPEKGAVAGIASQVKDVAVAAAGKVGALVKSAATAVKEAVTGTQSQPRRPPRNKREASA